MAILTFVKIPVFLHNFDAHILFNTSLNTCVAQFKSVLWQNARKKKFFYGWMNG